MAEYAEPKPIVGFIGMGGMGSRMAARILDAGYLLHVYNRDPQKAQALSQKGAKVARTPRELAAACHVIMFSVSDDAALHAVLLGPDGVLDGAPTGRIFIDLSTVYPGTSRNAFHVAKEKGIDFLDAPVSGTLPSAEQGTLLVMVGGERRTFDESKPLLEILGKPVYMGESGSGTMMKLVINAVLGTSLQALAEAIALGERAGLPKDQLLDVLGQTGVVSPSQKAKLENARRNEYPPLFPLHLMHKDFGLILRRAAELGVPMPATAAAEQMSAAGLAKGRDEDFSVVLRFMEELSAASSEKELAAAKK